MERRALHLRLRDDAGLTRSGGFRLGTGSPRGVSTAIKKGATLRSGSLRGHTFAVALRTGPRFGSVRIAVGGKVVQTVSLRGRAGTRILTTPARRGLTGPLTITSTSRQRVAVEGFAAAS